MQDFVNAADCYEQLTFLNPEVEDYKLYYAQSLYKACLFEESMKVSCQIDSPAYQTKVSKNCFIMAIQLLFLYTGTLKAQVIFIR